MSIIFAILLFSLLIFVHELGHFICAKLFGVQVNEFAIFMGPAIAKWKWGETQYSIRCIPIGGYCAMEGEDADTDNPRSFLKASRWKRLIILAAGSFMNFVAGVLIVSVVLFNQSTYATTQVIEVESWSTVTENNGLRPGDIIQEFDGKKIRIFEDFTLATMLLEDGDYDITVLRDGQEVSLDDVSMVRQAVQNPDGTQSMLYGITFGRAETTPGSVPGRILPTAFNYVRSVVMSLRMLVTGQAGLQDMTGPVGIVQIMSESAEAAEDTAGAFLNMLYFGGFIAINLSVMNMLPIPALDGGRIFGLILSTGYEKLTGKQADPKIEGYIHTAGMVLLLGFMAVIFLKDIINIFTR